MNLVSASVVLFFGIFSVLCCVTQSKVFTKCGLVQELLARNFPRTFIGNWVCLIESESGKDTSRETNKANGSKNLGLFQINNKDWCTFGKPGGKCSMKCEDLTNENLIDDSACAKRVYNALGFRAWDGWARSCYGREWPIPRC